MSQGFGAHQKFLSGLGSGHGSGAYYLGACLEVGGAHKVHSTGGSTRTKATETVSAAVSAAAASSATAASASVSASVASATEV